MKTKAAFCNNNPNGKLAGVYGKGRFEQVSELTDLLPEVISPENFDDHREALADIEVIFSTWGFPTFTEDQLNAMSSLKAVFYAAGSVKNFAKPYLERGITVVSAWQANATPVAEFTVAQIILGLKGYFRNTREYVSRDAQGKAYKGPGIYGERVALVGCGAIARQVIGLLRPYTIEVVVVDPYLTAEQAKSLGVKVVSLADAFATSQVISNHLPNLESLRNEISKSHFESMREGAVFINTGRGAQVDEEAMVEIFEQRTDLTALLDVTAPEPPDADSPLYTLPNIQLSTHIAGSMNDEVIRMADYVIDEFSRWKRGESLHGAVSLKMLETMA